AAHNYEILHERDDDDTERPDKRQKSGDRHQPTSQQSSHRSHGHNNDRHGSDRRGGSDNHRSSNNNYSGRVLVMDVTKETGVSSPTEEQAKNFQWGLRRSTLNHLMCMSYTDVAQVANAARNYEILHERDDENTERPNKRGVVIGISRPLSRVVTGATVIITTIMDLTGEVVVTTTAAATTTTLAVTTGIPVKGMTRETGVISPTDLSIL
nr:zinc finger, CCHC-type, retrotransposon Gag domain protein [Tanacetum cinerariifolium]